MSAINAVDIGKQIGELLYAAGDLRTQLSAVKSSIEASNSHLSHFQLGISVATFLFQTNLPKFSAQLETVREQFRALKATHRDSLRGELLILDVQLKFLKQLVRTVINPSIAQVVPDVCTEETKIPSIGSLCAKKLIRFETFHPKPLSPDLTSFTNGDGEESFTLPKAATEWTAEQRNALERLLKQGFSMKYGEIKRTMLQIPLRFRNGFYAHFAKVCKIEAKASQMASKGRELFNDSEKKAEAIEALIAYCRQN